jgi:hypothetical protein
MSDAAGFPLGPVSEAFVRARPEAQLAYPGASTVWPFWSGETSNVPESGRSSAFAGAVLATPDAPEQIYAWYERWLTEHGWARTRFLRAAGQPSIQGYARGQREVFSVGMDEPHALEETLGRPLPSDQTIFEYRYMVAPAP